MGEVIRLADHVAVRRRRAAGGGPAHTEFFFDLACPFTYLAAERVERSFDRVQWIPASAAALHRCAPDSDPAHVQRVRREAEERARELRLPLVWPERWPEDVPAAMRAAHFAAESGRGAEFVLAAGRLAFCGGFDLDDPEVLAEAAAAAGVGLEECLQAAGDVARDGPVEAAGRRLLKAGATCLPALRVGRVLFAGEHRVPEASAAARWGTIAAPRVGA